jgi:hypothetical protein
MVAKRRIEVCSAGWALCEDTIDTVNRLGCPS